ncbi:pyridoxamine 5'-phosphate oxidase family protein [Microbacterium mangrovi]|uniref:pyridoxamine 5'-phosphate oxidase family protein n=1 Tax=Microbacterium mangrovi TaxID=1348253 RepID=UPI00068B7B42|nr:pyridoxamine 5'-phosphate oxidase family protein [Microbacterium mangrovi]
MTPVWNADDPAHAKARRMLEHDLIAWFVTTASDGSPRSVPVWFFWQDDRMLVVSEPDTLKVAAVRRGAPVLMHLQAGGPYGDDVVILRGRAEISPSPSADWLAANREAYVAKYGEAIDDYGMPLDDIAAKFSTLIVFTPERVQAW